MYSKPSFQENLFDGLDVDSEEFEVSVVCPKKNRVITKYNYSTSRRTTTKKNFYIIKQPIQGFIDLKVFCHFCEKNYHLKINSEERKNKKTKYLIFMYCLLMFTFWYSNLPIGEVRYAVWVYLFYKVYQAFNVSFIEASSKHKAKMVRIWEPTQVSHQV